MGNNRRSANERARERASEDIGTGAGDVAQASGWDLSELLRLDAQSNLRNLKKKSGQYLMMWSEIRHSKN